MTTQVFANQATSQLASGIVSTALSITLNSGGGAKFPVISSSSQVFYATLYDAATKLLREIVLVTAVTGDVLTVVRGQDGTTAQNWGAGDYITLWVTRAMLNNFVQQAQAQAGSYNIATDTGSANAYVAVMTPALTAYPPGMPFTLFPTNTNTGASTVSLGPGAIPIVNPDGTALGSNTLLASGAYPMVINAASTAAILTGASQSLSGTGLATTGDVKWRPTQESITGWVGDTSTNGFTIGNGSSGSNYANANASALFTWVWTNFSQTQCPVLTSGGGASTRGVSAAADFAANKRITIPDMRGLTIAGLDVGGTNWWASVPVTIGSATTPGSVIGENLHTLVTAELAVHSHVNVLSNPTHTHSYLAPASGVGTGTSPNYFLSSNAAQTTGATAQNTTITNANAGSGTAHNTVQQTMLGTFFFKL